MSIKHAAITTVALLASVAAHADSKEWRVLGPAASYHLTKEGAAITKPKSSTQECTDNFGNLPPPQSYTSPTPIPGAIAIGRTPEGDYIYMPMPAPAVMECKVITEPAERGWHGNNPALGLEASWRYDTHVDKAFGTFVRDSYGKPGFMAGVARMWPVGSIGSLSLDAGATGGLWYREALNYDTDELHRVLIPYVLPAFSVNESNTGIGINAAVVPRLSFKGRYFSSTWAVIAQLTYLVSKKETGTKQLSLEADPSGGLRASYAVSF